MNGIQPLPTDKERPKCSRCKAPLVVPEDMPQWVEGFIGEWDDEWRGKQLPFCFVCWENHGDACARRPVYVAGTYAQWCEYKLAEEERLLKKWNKGPGAPLCKTRGGGRRMAEGLRTDNENA